MMAAPLRVNEERPCRDCLFAVGLVTLACTNGTVKAAQSYRTEALADVERHNPFGYCGPNGNLWQPRD